MTDDEMADVRISGLSLVRLAHDPDVFASEVLRADELAVWISTGKVPVVPVVPVSKSALHLPGGIVIEHGRKLGAKPPKRDERVPRLTQVAGCLPSAPTVHTVYVQAVTSWVLGENDRIGDCTCVGPANAILAWTTLAGRPYRIADNNIISFYAGVSGYVPGDVNTDQGAMIEDVLAAWHAHGIGLQPVDMLDGYASIEVGNHEMVKQAVNALGPVDIGVNLPTGWMQAKVWSVDTALNETAGGHCVTVVGYTLDGPLVVSWGQVFPMTWSGWDAYVTEAHSLLSRDALTAAGKDVEGVDWAALETFMSIIRLAS